jgi:hypothetical protein
LRHVGQALIDLRLRRGCGIDVVALLDSGATMVPFRRMEIRLHSAILSWAAILRRSQK